MTTYNDLLCFITKNKLSLLELQNLPRKYCYEPLEDLFVLFSHLKLVNKFHNFTISNESFNNGNFNNNFQLKSFLERKCKNNGSFSDLTLFNENTIIATTCKNLHNPTLTKLDLLKISDTFNKSNDKRELIFCIVIKDKEILQQKIQKAQKTSKVLVDILTNTTTLIFDWNDIYKWYLILLNNPNLEINSKPSIQLKYHQKLAVDKFFESEKTNFILSCKPRSGKTFIMGKIISEMKQGNYLIITTAPTETLLQTFKLFKDYSDFDNFNVVVCNGKTEIKDGNNIFLCSIQFLKHKSENYFKNNFKNIHFNLICIDESHYGGITEKAETIYNLFGNSKKIFISATPRKVKSKIKDFTEFKWSLYDEWNCKTNEINHEFFNKKDYLGMPILKPIVLSLQKEFKQQLKEFIKENNGCFDIQNLFCMENKTFKYPKMLYEFSKCLGGSNEKFSVYNEHILYRIEKEQPLEKRVVLMYLPCHLSNTKLSDLSNEYINFIKKYELFPNYSVIQINSVSNGTNNPINIINNELNKLDHFKKGIICLVGKQLQLGVSLPLCDTIILCNGITNRDTIEQTIFRSMTEMKDKKYGYFIDCDLQRKITIDLIMNYSFEINKSSCNDNIKKSIKQVLKFIQINNKEWLGENLHFDLSEKIYNLYCNNLKYNIDDKIEDFEIYFNDDIQKKINYLVE